MNIEFLLANPDNIPMLPDTAIRLQELLHSDCSTIDDIAEVVSFDPTLTSKLLKLANSAFYSFAAEIDTVSRAVGIIGSDAVYNLALANSAIDSLSALGADCIDLDRFWRQSVDAGLIARELAKSSGISHSERLFVCGLLANLGELICADQYPEKAREASTDNTQDTTLPWDKQQAVLGFTYAELTQELMKIWRLPDAITNSVGCIYRPEKSENPIETRVLHIAWMAAIGLGEKDRFQLEELITIDDLSTIGVDMEILINAIEYSNLEALNILSILSPQSMVIF
jgi:HD-like signal output (HDOD) protein